jgi:hypothetical protein
MFYGNSAGRKEILKEIYWLKKNFMTSVHDQKQAQRSRHVFWFFIVDWQKVQLALV